jgi:segregation and condensation protein B
VPDDRQTTPALDTLGHAGRQGLEAILFLADEPAPAEVLATALEVDETVVEAAAAELAREYEAAGRGIEVRRAAGGWRMYSAEGARAVLERWALDGRSGRLTQAALETLAVIAYKQPISRQRIGDIRGVSADAAVRSLVARGLVAEVGRDPGPGQAVLYGTTTAFLERLGLESLDELPPLTDYLPDAPAPDEPELGALKEIRRRLAAAGGRDTEPIEPADELPDPRPAPREHAGIDDLTDQLETAARNAMSRLRQVVANEDEESPDG